MELENTDVSQPNLHIRVLGDFSLTYGGKLLTSLVSPRLQSLLVYLLLHRGAPQSRQHLAFLFWPDLPEDRARNNLRQALHQLRQILPDANRYLEADSLSVFWRLDSAYRLDAAVFEQELAAAHAAELTGNQSALRSALERALAIYQGSLLPSCYDDWIAAEKERLHQKYLAALEQYVLLLEGQRDYPAAISFAQQLIRQDHLYENGYQLLMRLYALNNDRANALRTYHACIEALQRELGVEPEQATREIYKRLLEVRAPIPEANEDTKRMPPLVGRENLWLQLLAAWTRSANGKPHFVLLIGEAGIGKTRLGEELLEWAGRQGYDTAKTRAYAAEGRLSYDPIIGWLRSEACRAALAKLEKVWLTELSRLLPELLYEMPDLSPPEPLLEHWQRQKFFQAMARAILVAPQPLLLVIDDLQWCDPETLEWLHYLLRADPQARLLLVGTVRVEEMVPNRSLQEFLSDLRGNAFLTEITLKPLDAAETSRLATQAAAQELEPETAFRLFRETEGNPLFILETVRSGFLTGEGPAGALQPTGAVYKPQMDNAQRLPPKVRAVIATRLAQLSPPARELAGLAAVTGRAFTFQLLAQAGQVPEENLARWLEELWQRRIVREMGVNTYDFSHDKIREVAYAEISPPARPLLHRRVARALEKIHASDLDPVSGQVAVHFERAGMPEEAITFQHRAAVVAQRVGANEEAVLFLEKALELHRLLAEGLERDRLELDLQMALGASLVASRGYSAPEVIGVYDRAQALCRLLDQPPGPPILRALAIANVARAEFRKSLGFGKQLLDMARNQNSSFLEVEARYVLGVASFWLGAFEPAREYLAESVRQYQPDNSRTHIMLYSQDPKPVCLSRLAYALWFLGYPSQAVETSREAIEYASELGHPLTSAYAMYHDAALYNHLQAFSQAEEKGKALVGLAQEHRLPFWLGSGYMVMGWSRAELGQIQEGIDLIRDGIKTYRAAGAEHVYVFYLSLLGELYGQIGQSDLGLSFQSDALAIIERSEERWCEAEVHRRQGELLLKQADEAGAEKAFRRAINIAHSQGARMLELHAAAQLARLWIEQDRDSQARQLLLPLYGWFREGFDLPDLINARKLLEK